MTVSGLSAGTTYYFAIKTADEVPNWSAISNSPSGTTTSGSDTTAPAAVANLATSSPTSSSIHLSWTAPGDDGSTGTATSYDVRYSTSAINEGNWASATQATGEPTPQAAGTGQSMTVSGLSAGTTYYFAIKTSDEVPNTSAISNSPSGTTSAAGGAFIEASGQVVMEAEHFTGAAINSDPSGNNWTEATAASGYVHTGYMLAPTGTTPTWATGAELSYDISFSTTGTYNVWVRRNVVDTNTNSVFWGVDGTVASGNDNGGTYGSWVWVNLGSTSISTTGTKTFQLRRRESGYRVDRVLLTTSASTPSGEGPAESSQGGGSDTTAPAAVSNLATGSPTSSSIQLTWTAPGDDGSTGTATTYDIRYRTGGAVNDSNWSTAIQVLSEPTPQAAGTGQSMTVSGLSASTTYYFAIKTSDEVPNTSAISNSPSGTTNAAGDTTAPAAVTNLATGSPSSSSIQLTWTAPGDDGSTGTATSYDVRYSTSAIDEGNWASATQATGEPTPAVAGTGQSMTVTGLSASTTYYFAIKTSDEVPNVSAISNSPSGTTSAASLNLLTNGDFQTATAFTNATYTAGTSTDGVWYSANWANTADAGDAGTGDRAAKVLNANSDLRLLQGITAPSNGTDMSLSFKYIRPSGYSSRVRVYGLTSGQQISPYAGGTLQGTQLFNYDLSNQSSWTSVTNQTFTVSGTYAKLVVYVSMGGNANDAIDDVVLVESEGLGMAAPQFQTEQEDSSWRTYRPSTTDAAPEEVPASAVEEPAEEPAPAEEPVVPLDEAWQIQEPEVSGDEPAVDPGDESATPDADPAEADDAPSAPTASDAAYTVRSATVLEGRVSGSGDEGVTYLLVESPSHGTLVFWADGTFTYAPDAGYTGPDRFTFQASDGAATSPPATASITVEEAYGTRRSRGR